MSEARATSALVATSFAPAARMSASGARLRLTRTVSGKPLVTRFFAMPWPIRPSPMKPIRGFASICRSSWCALSGEGGIGRVVRPILHGGGG
jgi:hypothetical protein